jgi:transcriptional regulator with XRE-family HTH domain
MNELNIKKIRNKLNVTQKEFSELIGVDIKTVQNWEAGRKISATKYGIIQKLLNEKKTAATATDGIPYYENLPVSAGQGSLNLVPQVETPTGYISIPGVSAIAAFPVVGCSMEPEIKPGDYIAVVPLDRLESIDPDKTYLIITRDDRMIKHLHADLDDDDILWAQSPNYPKFRILKAEILALYRITFHGRTL